MNYTNILIDILGIILSIMLVTISIFGLFSVSREFTNKHLNNQEDIE